MSSVEIVKDEKWFYTTLERRRVIHVQERFDNMFENNKAFAMFQVFEVNRPADESRIFLFGPFVINAGRKRTLTVFNNGLALEIFPSQMRLKKFTAGGDVMPTTDPVLPRLSSQIKH